MNDAGSASRSGDPEVVLADDLSGALEVAVPFTWGCRSVMLPLEARVARPRAGALVVMNTETRNSSASEARAIVGDALARARDAGARVVFKKIDSTLRGPVGAELAAMLDASPHALLVVCPTNVRVGRTVCDGVLRVHGVPVSETAFREDPRWPILDSEVAKSCDPAGAFVSERVSLETCRAGADAVASALIRFREAGVQVAYCDAETEADLAALAGGLVALDRACVPIGAGGLARALCASRGDGVTRGWIRPTAGGMLFAVGSRHPASRAQLERLSAECGVEVRTIDAGDVEEERARVVAGDLARGGIAALRFGEGHGGDPAMLAQLGEIVRRVDGFDALFATGGETASALCRALGIDALEVLGELDPGVVFARTSGRPGVSTVVVKPGGFGDADCLVRVWRAAGLRRRA
ncbi:four-carbon acid sugar kinase family protein [Opitutales bacterium ASA1]|uniref:four-carbon acid sugar kinase family protein n=1 Tax=Congregicoccus parvus TaxID=3081749 RepID=UPI002B2E022E|nr:four-carbon acid sugar kinase family protein [Opitutales bacterium ASA1]